MNSILFSNYKVITHVLNILLKKKNANKVKKCVILNYCIFNFISQLFIYLLQTFM